MNTQTLDVSTLCNIIEENTDNIENGENQTGMCYWAAITGDLNLIEKALSSEVNVNFQNSSGHTPLHVAVMHNHEPIVEKLLENGADVNITTNQSWKNFWKTEQMLILKRMKGLHQFVWLN
ncbi:Ankyrin repeats (3 copies) [Popillia japonica]|uniref:Ankyrin repeats (3 copies) n=1 Tax=Popillia japonica TaxID=7064 RepID=A0AAW1L4H0_POPJA